MGVQRRLEAVLAFLQAEYLSRGAGAWALPAREFLRELFGDGRDRRAALIQVTNLLARETDNLRQTPPDRRDGMLYEAVRELSDSAAGQAGQTAVLVEALEQVAECMRTSRTESDPSPEGRELRNEFDAGYRTAMDEWNRKAAQRDPMGRELEYFERLHASAK